MIAVVPRPLVLLLLAIFSASVLGVTVQAVDTFRRSQILYAAPALDLAFPEDMQAALNAGVGLTINLDIEVHAPVDYWFDNLVFRVRHTYTVERHELSERFLVTDTIRGERWTFKTLREATAFLAALPPVAIGEVAILEQYPRLVARLRARLDVESLPAPMRPAVYLSPGWWRGTNWFEWEITP